MAETLSVDAPSLSVIFPTYNESLNIVELLERTIKILRPKDEIIIVDDNSPDQTAAIAKSYLDTRPNNQVKILVRTKNPGLTASLCDGIKMTNGEIIVWLDADLSQPPELIPLLIQKMLIENAKIVVASRYVLGGKDVRGNCGQELIKFQVILSQILKYISQFVLTSKFNDWSSGYIAIYKKTLNSLSPLEGRHGEYFIPLIYESLIKGHKVIEIPYSLIPRAKGQSKTGTSFLEMCLTGTQYLALLFKTRWRFKNYN